MTDAPRIAVVAYNLGGPDSPAAVAPFLFNLFNDPLILRLPGPLRWLVAKLIATRRAPVATEIYDRIGGRSPILAETRAQAAALERALDDPAIRVFVAMRYWHPFAEECAEAVKAFDPARIVLLPLYPQFSTTTTASFLRVWKKAAAMTGLSAESAALCCWPAEPGFVEALAQSTRKAIGEAAAKGPVRVLFSAHGLPKKFVTAGDPYQAQVERTVAALLARLGMTGLDHVICYQSRVGPLEWIRPYTDEEVRRAAQGGHAVVVVPVAFVSEHSETLVELDMEYRQLALENGAAAYLRVPTVGTSPVFIDGLARLVRGAAATAGVRSGAGERICDAAARPCPFGAALR